RTARLSECAAAGWQSQHSGVDAQRGHRHLAVRVDPVGSCHRDRGLADRGHAVHLGDGNVMNHHVSSAYLHWYRSKLICPWINVVPEKYDAGKQLFRDHPTTVRLFTTGILSLRSEERRVGRECSKCCVWYIK